MSWKIPLFNIYWEQDDIDSVVKVIKRGRYWTTGPEIAELEKKIAKYVGTKYALSFNSGTSALHADLLAHNISGGEVIVPSFTFISTANAIILAGAKPIFAEIEEMSYGLDIENVKEKINKKTKAIIPVHYGGAPCKDIRALCEIAEDKKILLIEDAAESLGSKIKNKMIGSFGDSSMFSFCQNKVITAGEGGVALTDSIKVYQKLKLIRSHGRQDKGYDYFSTDKEFNYIQLGYNFRMSSISAALAISQFKKIEKIIEMRRKIAKYLNKELSDINGIKIPIELEEYYNVYQMYTIRLNTKTHREKLQQYLKEKGIMTKVYFHPIHLKTYYKNEIGYNKGDLPKTEKISEEVLSLPIFPNISKKDLDQIIKQIKKFLSDSDNI